MKRKLGEICRIVSGSTPKTGVPEYWDGDLKWITPAELDDESRIVDSTKRTITELGAAKTGLTPLPAGTVLLSSRAPIGKVAITGCEMYCNQGFKNLVCSDSVNNKYLYWFLKGKTQYLNSLGRGATFKEISKTIVADIEINLPDIEEQEKIVNRIEKIDSRLSMLRAEISRLDELIKARFVEMFSDKNTANSVLIGEAVELINGRAFKPTDWTVSGLPIIRIQNLNDPKAPYNHFDGSYDKKNYVEKGELLFSWSGTPRTSFGAFIWDREPGLLNQHIFRVLPKKDYDLKFLRFALNAQLDEIISKAHGGVGLQHITKSELEKISIPYPSREQQAVFSNFVARVDKSKFLTNQNLHFKTAS